MLDRRFGLDCDSLKFLQVLSNSAGELSLIAGRQCLILATLFNLNSKRIKRAVENVGSCILYGEMHGGTLFRKR